MKLCLLAIISQISGIHTLIVPDVNQELLLLFFSTIPTLKKGTDSRLGWGFSIGRHADFQMMVELGPQTYTQPLANQENRNTNNKRNAINGPFGTLYAQRHKEEERNRDSEGGKWLKMWSQKNKLGNSVGKLTKQQYKAESTTTKKSGNVDESTTARGPE